MNDSFKISEYIDSIASSITSNKGLYNIFVNPLYITLILAIIICLICFLSVKASQSFKTYVKIFFYTTIIMALIEMLRNSVLKKYYVNKYSENPNNKLISDITSSSNMFLGGNNSSINIEPRKFEANNININNNVDNQFNNESDNLDDISFNEKN